MTEESGGVRRWFGSVNLSAQVLPVAEAIIDEVVNMLDVLDPQLVDRGRAQSAPERPDPGRAEYSPPESPAYRTLKRRSMSRLMAAARW